MKHEDFFDKHSDHRKSIKKHKKKKLNENAEPKLKRVIKTSFKNYLKVIEDELLEDRMVDYEYYFAED